MARHIWIGTNMVAPLVAIAAAAAARAVAAAAGKKVVSGTIGKRSGAAYAAAKSAASAKAKASALKAAADKKAFKEIAKRKPLPNPKSAVKVKPSAKTPGNPLNRTKTSHYMSGSANRGAGPEGPYRRGGPVGKKKIGRIERSAKNKPGAPDVRFDAGSDPWKSNVVKINSQRNLKKKTK